MGIVGLDVTDSSGSRFINNNGSLTLKNNNFLNNSFYNIVNNTGTLKLSNTIIQGNSAEFVNVITNINGTVTLENSTIDDIGALGESVSIRSSGGIVNINNSTISNNSNRNFEVGIISSGILTISNSTISNNSSFGTDSIITNSGVLTVKDSVFSDNFNTSISNFGTLIVSNTTFSNNGSGIKNFGTLTVSNTTFSNNQNEAVDNQDFATINNSTISGNQESGISNDGTLTINNSTIIRNSSRGFRGVGGVNSSSGTATINNSIIAGNFVLDTDDPTIVSVPDVLGNFISNGYNLIGDLSGSTGFDADEQLQVDLTEVLDITLRDNGGTVKTHALLTGSVAINAGRNADVPADVTDLDGDRNIRERVPFDGRGSGFARISGGRVDVGAFEAVVNVINGTAGRNRIKGTAGDDIITGFQGADTLTGGDGKDAFVYTRVRDAGDTITDFDPGTDKIVLRQLFASLGLDNINYTNAIADGYLRFKTQGNNTIVLIDTDGSSGSGRAVKFVELNKVSATELNNANNFAF
ncbi:MAG: hypothetical protein KME21_07430 [Desmonostoc vinosum HA7617-LM4]|nr:hypothetical protein [Desmonostoc vinosum HA7617-LM4]